MQEVVDDPTAKRVIEFVSAGTSFGRALMAPPGVPADRLAALRGAFDTLVKDPAFLKDAERAKAQIDPDLGRGAAAGPDRAVQGAEGHRRARQGGDGLRAVYVTHASSFSRGACSSEVCQFPSTQRGKRSADRRSGASAPVYERASNAGPRVPRRSSFRTPRAGGRSPLGAPPRRFIGLRSRADEVVGALLLVLMRAPRVHP